MTLTDFLNKLSKSPETVDFKDTITTIENNYEFSETSFKNGDVFNKSGQNSGSCKIFAFAQIHALSKEATLNCFGDYYRTDVLRNPQATDHANIRNFMIHGWGGIKFENSALTIK